MKAEQYPNFYLYKRVVQAKLFIDKHYTEAIDLSNIADEAYYSKFHFIRLFKKIYGKTPHNYLTQVRIDRAKLLLAENIQVAEVCLMVGFDSSTSFTALFKKGTGITPSVFQARQQVKKSAIRSNPLQFVPNCFAETHGWAKK